jgi:hypothetical protein
MKEETVKFLARIPASQWAILTKKVQESMDPDKKKVSYNTLVNRAISKMYGG